MMKKTLLFASICLLPILSSCGSSGKSVKLFLSSNEEVDINEIKEAFPDDALEVSYSNPTSIYYSLLYKTAREKDYDIFVMRDSEYTQSDIPNIYIPFDDGNMSYLGSKTHTFYKIKGVKYGIKLNDGDYKINSYMSFEEGHDYYLSLAKFSRNVGNYSLYSTKSYSAFEFLSKLL